MNILIMKKFGIKQKTSEELNEDTDGDEEPKTCLTHPSNIFGLTMIIHE